MLLFSIYIFFGTSYILPKNIMLIEGKEYTYHFNTPINVGITADKHGTIKLNGNDIDNNYKISLKDPVKFESSELGYTNLKLSLFGSIPIRTISVNVIPKSVVVPCGNTIGIKIQTKGLLVVGTTYLTGFDGKDYKPYKDANIKQGDIIIEANSKKINNINQFFDTIMLSKGKSIDITLQRNSSLKTTKITPIKCIDGNYKVGLWVRDSTSGIGTLTFFDPKTKKFAALGHGIMDIDTGTLLTVERGQVVESNITSVKKGEKGNPGELKGSFTTNKSRGKIILNTEYGIYGLLSDMNIAGGNGKTIQIAFKDEVLEGPATILSNVDGKEIESFDIEIQKVVRSGYNGPKNMVIKVTDKNLIARTGGIVQGMSGSPIIQNGKLIGAVTHVFISDSTRGYGIFAEYMIKGISEVDKK